MKKPTVLTLILLLCTCLSQAQESAQHRSVQDSLLNQLEGKWVLRGTIGGSETTHDIICEWVLGDQYLQMKEISREKDMAGRPLYDAIVYLTWNHTTNEYDCLWLDNTGYGGLNGQAVGHSAQVDGRLEFLFKGSDGSIFHTTFVHDNENDTWKWLMDGESNGKLQPFARVTLTKEKK